MAPIKMFMVDTGSLIPLKNPVFTTGDAYIVVDEESKKIFIWLGSKCSVDEKGTAAVEARRIDDGQVFNGSAHIITFDEGDESPEFVSKIPGLKILDKNLAKSMLKDVKTGEFAGQENHVNALYRISSEEYNGINAIKYVQVPFEKSSLDSEDCFIADLGVDIWVWQGKDSNVKEKVKAMQYAREFDANRAGDQRSKVFIEDADDEQFLAIFEGKLPHQDRRTYDLKVERFDEAPLKSVHKEINEPQKHISSELKKMETDEKGIMIQKGDGRLQCPKCGSVNRGMFREVEDKTNILNPYPLVYGKKWVCGECGGSWRRLEE